MAEPTSKFTSETTDFVARNAWQAERIAKEPEISSNALMGAIANEHDTRFNPDLSFDTRGSTGQWVGDWLESGQTHQKNFENYNAVKNDPLRGSKIRKYCYAGCRSWQH